MLTKYYKIENLEEPTKELVAFKSYLYFDNEKNCYLSDKTLQHLKNHFPSLALLNHAKLKEFSEVELKSVQKRVHYTLESYIQDPPNQYVMLEIYLFLYANKNLSIEYKGRNLLGVENPKVGFIKEHDSIFSFDIVNGKRKYYWMVRSKDFEFNSVDAKSKFSAIHEWFNEPDCKIILSLGSGGARMFAIPTIFKIIDMLNVRDKISEVWGCSGGSIMGTCYSLGIAPHWLEQMAYDFYNDRFPDFLLKKTQSKMIMFLAKNIKNRLSRLTNPTAGLTDIQQVYLDVLNRFIQKKDPLLKELPMFCIASNLNSNSLCALTSPKNITESCRKFLVPCNDLQAMCASSAIPFIFPSEQIPFVDQMMHTWVDGLVSEEVPMIHPFIKHNLEMNDSNNKEVKKFKKVKIFYVDLGMRAEELSFYKFLEKNKNILGKLHLAGQLFDKMFNSNLEKSMAILKTFPNIEIIGVKLKINKFAALDGGAIPYIIQEGRRCFLSQLETINQEFLDKKERTKKAA